VLQIIFGLLQELYLNLLNVLLITAHGKQIHLMLEMNVPIKLTNGLIRGL
jgi:hypothetical protein